MIFGFMRRHESEYRIGVMCEVLNVSRSGYYAWRRRSESERSPANTKLLEAIYKVHHDSGGTDGSSRIYQELVFLQRYSTRFHARQSLFEDIERFYNRGRLHSTLGYRSPAENEAAYF